MPSFSISVNADRSVELWPGESAVFKITTTTHLPINVMGLIAVNSEVLNEAVSRVSSQGYPPGYQGKIQLVVTNISSNAQVKIKAGDLLGWFMTVALRPL